MAAALGRDFQKFGRRFQRPMADDWDRRLTYVPARSSCPSLNTTCSSAKLTRGTTLRPTQRRRWLIFLVAVGACICSSAVRNLSAAGFRCLLLEQVICASAPLLLLLLGCSVHRAALIRSTAHCTPMMPIAVTTCE